MDAQGVTKPPFGAHSAPLPTPLVGSITGPVLCVGVDLTWWGGSKSKGSRSETVAWSSRSESGWSVPQLSRIFLGDYNKKADDQTPNCDPGGERLLSRISEINRLHPEIQNTVVSLDAPLLALDQGLPSRRKTPAIGEVQRRQADSRFADVLSLSPTGWRGVKIQPGAPLAPRVASILDGLKQQKYHLFTGDNPGAGGRIVIECFPNEALWSAGVLGLCDGFCFQTMTTYKRLGKAKVILPTLILEKICRYTLEPCIRAAGVEPAVWVDAFWNWLNQDKDVVRGPRALSGKALDDAIDSMLSLVAAIAFADGNAHMHQGHDPSDGHIVGPGLPIFMRKP